MIAHQSDIDQFRMFHAASLQRPLMESEERLLASLRIILRKCFVPPDVYTALTKR